MKAELRYGYVCELWYRHMKMDLPGQLDLLYEWFGDLIVEPEDSDGKTKKDPYFDENELVIRAVRYGGKLYAGGEPNVTQLCGRLVGTAKGSREKQRKNAVLLQKHLARFMAESKELIEALQENVYEHLAALEGDAFTAFAQDLVEFILTAAYQRSEMSDTEKDGEPFPFDDEIFDAVVYNAAYQYMLGTADGLINAYLWLLIGSLLRNEAGRICRRCDTSFNSVYKAPGEDETLLAKLDYLFFPEDYEYTYDGDDVTSRFPDMIWKCDHCGALLNDQEGFDDRFDAWQCRRCGTINPISAEAAYEWEEDAKQKVRPMDQAKMQAAIERRKAELEKNEG